ncbi:MAG: ABC transporter permease [Coriobacteriia bacterium]|nr:ABC transporter permease [Coriobacteriia bacterium]
MNFAESFRIALRALTANKVRSMLTMLGVIIGVAAVILLVAIGTGVQGEVTGAVQGLGSNLLFIFPAQINTGGGGGGGSPFGGGGGGRGFRLADARYLQQRVTGVDAIVPVAQSVGTAKSANRSIRSTLAGATEQGKDVFTATLGAGRHYNRSEVDASARVAAIGFTVKTELFPTGDPIGKTMTINGQRFRVIGWYQKQGGSLSGDQDNQIYMPITTLQTLTSNNRVGIIMAKVTDAAEIENVRAQIKRALTPRFGTEFTVFSQDQTLGIFNELLGTLTIMLAGIAGISLLVGGIGIMNIMLVSVSERTREIGIRKAVGARTYDILSQFVIEAMLLSLTGGIVGILVGAASAWGIQTWVPTEISPWAVAMAFFFSAGVGIFFGVYPAWKASKLDPIVALRYE